MRAVWLMLRDDLTIYTDFLQQKLKVVNNEKVCYITVMEKMFAYVIRKQKMDLFVFLNRLVQRQAKE